MNALIVTREAEQIADVAGLDARFAARDEECQQLLAALGPLDLGTRLLTLDLLKASAPEERDPQLLLQFARWLLGSAGRDQFLKRHARGCIVRRREQGFEFEEYPTRADAVGLPFHKVALEEGVFIPAHHARPHQALQQRAEINDVGHAAEPVAAAPEGQAR